MLKKRVLKLLKDIDILKMESISKTEASNELLRMVENMKLENSSNNAAMNRLKVENTTLTAEKANSARCLTDLRRTLNEKDLQCNELQRKNVSH